MATKNSAQTRSDTIEVTNLDQAKALAAAWDGIYHFFGGRVDSWELLPPSDDNPNGGIVAHGFSVNNTIDPHQVISDIGKRNRRLEMFPNYFWLFGGITPPDFTEAQDMTNFMVQYLKGSVEEGTAKTPEYVRNAVSQYKADAGLRTRRGPKRKIIRLDNLSDIDASQLSEIPEDQLAQFLALAQSVQNRQAITKAANVEKDKEAVAVS